MNQGIVTRTMIAVSFLEIAAQSMDALPVDIGRAIERVLAGFREAPKSFNEEHKARAVAALVDVYEWREGRVDAFLRSMNEAFATDLGDAKDLIMRR